MIENYTKLSYSDLFILFFSASIFIVFILLFLRKIYLLFSISADVFFNKLTLSWNNINSVITTKKFITNDDIVYILDNAYNEYRLLSNIITSKITFFLSSQVVVGSLFSYFLYKIKDINNLSFYYILIPFFISFFTYFLYNNILNTINIYRNTIIIIEYYERIYNINLLKFYNNGFYKQTFTDYDFITFITLFLIPCWIIFGSYLIYGRINYYVFICLFALLFFIFSDIVVNNKKYKLIKNME